MDKHSSMTQPCIVPRQKWKANPPRNNISLNTKRLWYVFCCATNLDFSNGINKCSGQMRVLQFRHMKTYAVPDIKYNFVICRHGTVFEGRGFGQAPGLPMKYLNFNKLSLFIGLHGIFEDNPPPPEMTQALNDLIRSGMEQGFLGPRITQFNL